MGIGPSSLWEYHSLANWTYKGSTSLCEPASNLPLWFLLCSLTVEWVPWPELMLWETASPLLDCGSDVIRYVSSCSIFCLDFPSVWTITENYKSNKPSLLSCLWSECFSTVMKRKVEDFVKVFTQSFSMSLLPSLLTLQVYLISKPVFGT